MLIVNLREIETTMPLNPPAVTVIAEKSSETEPDAIKTRPAIEHPRSRPSNVEKQPYAEYQVTLEEQMICGALQTLNEEAMEDVLQSEPPSHQGEPLHPTRESAPTLAPPTANHVPPTVNHAPPTNEDAPHFVLNIPEEDVFM